ncbi:MAG: hypothetical protein KC478_15715 [Bacteriovoracaceae bacterium]|nr:hypothetical protein [Bacteriovoracaceae bacterium]
MVIEVTLKIELSFSELYHNLLEELVVPNSKFRGTSDDPLPEEYKWIYSYDNNGNLIQKTSKQILGTFIKFTFNSDNQLVKIEEFKNNVKIKTVVYTYDALGRRIAKDIVDHLNTSKSHARKYAYDGQEILAEFDENDATLAVYTHSTLRTDDVLAVDIRSNKLANQTGSYFYLKDALGSVVDVTDANGNLVQHYTYSSFGKVLKIVDSSGTDVTSNPLAKTSYGFTNREHDAESGMMYYRARYYQPEIGRFISEDSDAGRFEIPVTVVNKYVYVMNNSIMYTDPQGKFPWAIFFAFGVLQGMTNYMQAKDAGADDGKAWGSFLVGLLAGGTSSVVGGGPWVAGLQIFGISTLHNAINQMIFTEKVNVGLALTSGGMAGLAGGFGYKAAVKFDLRWAPGFSSWISNGGQWLFNSTTTSSGIPTRCSKGDFDEGSRVEPTYEASVELCI